MGKEREQRIPSVLFLTQSNFGHCPGSLFPGDTLLFVLPRCGTLMPTPQRWDLLPSTNDDSHARILGSSPNASLTVAMLTLITI